MFKVLLTARKSRDTNPSYRVTGRSHDLHIIAEVSAITFVYSGLFFIAERHSLFWLSILMLQYYRSESYQIGGVSISYLRASVTPLDTIAIRFRDLPQYHKFLHFRI